MRHCTPTFARIQGKLSFRVSEGQGGREERTRGSGLIRHGPHSPRRFREAMPIVACPVPTGVVKRLEGCVCLESGAIGLTLARTAADSVDPGFGELRTGEGLRIKLPRRKPSLDAQHLQASGLLGILQLAGRARQQAGQFDELGGIRRKWSSRLYPRFDLTRPKEVGGGISKIGADPDVKLLRVGRRGDFVLTKD